MIGIRPAPVPGLREGDFRKICQNGFGDGHNAYAYSMASFGEHLYVGTSRANLMLLKFAMPFVRMDVWPVECPHPNYSAPFERDSARGEIWRYHPPSDLWTRVFQAPFTADAEGEFSRDLGYRGMVEFQGASDPAPALYVSTWSRSRGSGPDLLRTLDGTHFELLPKPQFQNQGRPLTFNAIRILTPFKGRLFTAPAGATKGNVNVSGVSLIYSTDAPATGKWVCVNEPGFGQFPDVFTVYEMAVLGDWLYAGTSGLHGLQIWRTRAEGDLPYHWECVVSGGAGRGALNQIAVSMIPFQDALYVGTGIQNGGHDWRNKVGPAAAEIIRINKNGSWDIIVGNPRDGKEPLSGLAAGFNNYFSGYIWRMGVHDGWLYAGTMDWGVILKFTELKKRPLQLARIIAGSGVDEFVACRGGFELWRTCDGENWLSVTRRGFGNPYNFGCRSIVSTPHGLFVGSANPFGPKVACRKNRKEWEWTYETNPDGGLEVWRGQTVSAALAGGHLT
jgi:hypothetical protein